MWIINEQGEEVKVTREMLEEWLDNRVTDEQKWGDWTLDAKTGTVWLQREGVEIYHISLETIHDSARMLDWIFQLRAKRWVTNEIIGDLVSAFAAIFDPQATLCSWGRGASIQDVREFLQGRIK